MRALFWLVYHVIAVTIVVWAVMAAWSLRDPQPHHVPSQNMCNPHSGLQKETAREA